MSRIGGDVVVECLRALGADTVFGLPGQHALGLFEALRRAAGVRVVSGRVENNVVFAADGFARERLAAGGCAVTPVVVSTGPGALLALSSLQEARESSVPLLVVASQVPVAGLGGARRGFLHELPDQGGVAAGVVKSVHRVRSVEQVPGVLAQAWSSACSVPFGPVWVEVPQDVLAGPAVVPVVEELCAAGSVPVAGGSLLDAAAEVLRGAVSPVVLAGGGVVRSGAQASLLELAESLRAPVVCTVGGKGAFPWGHPLSAQSWVEDAATTELLASADVLVVLGSGLGELSSNYHSLRPRGRVVQVDADVGRLGANHRVLGLHSDVDAAVRGLVERLSPRAVDGRAEAVVAGLLARVRGRLDAQDLGVERRVLAAVREALPVGAVSCWDMTVLGYWAWSAWDADGARMHSAQGAGGLGFGFPAALGAAVASGGPVLAVSGDGGAMYGLAELAVAVQEGLDVTWLIVDDGGYGILREYAQARFGVSAGVELVRPDFAAVAGAFGVRAVVSAPERLREDVAAELSRPGPGVVVLPRRLGMFAASHPV